jgi:formylglycine-generating enzyme required for sulfatase activity
LIPPLELDDQAFYEFVEEQSAAGRCRDSAFATQSRFNNPMQPVTGVSLWEAQAYCRWLSKRWGRDVRLPTEAEWEVAARGGEARCVEWPGQPGRFPPQGSVNNRDVKLRSTSPVGCFPGGNTPDPGFMDLCGQVWEWTSSVHSEEGLNKQLVESEAASDSGATRTVRGGSWGNPANNCRAAIRDRVHPGSRNDNLGFRWVVCPIL